MDQLKPILELLIKKPWPRWLKLLVALLGITILVITSLAALLTIADSDHWLRSPVIIGLQSPFYRKTESLSVDKELPEKEDDPRMPFNPDLVPTPQNDNYPKRYCSNFEEKDWKGWEGFDRSKTNPKVLKPALDSQPYDNPHLWYAKVTPKPIFDFELKLEPKHETRINATIAYKTIWRCIVGEQGYDNVTCEEYYSDASKKKRYRKYFSELEKLPINPGTEIIINGTTLKTGENKLEIRLQVNYININNERSSADFSFEVVLPSPDPLGLEGPIGVGIIDSDRASPPVEFKEFCLTLR